MQVTLNMAASLDGRVAGLGGAPIELSGPEDWARVHRLRAASDGILVGIGTILSDDPHLTARTQPAPRHPPMRIVLDSRLRVPPAARVLDEAAPSIVLTAEAASTDLEAETVACGQDRVDPALALEHLTDRGLEHLLIEGGPTVARSFLEAGLVDRFHLYLAPRLLGTGPSLWDALAGLERELVPRSRAPLGPGTLVSYEVPG